MASTNVEDDWFLDLTKRRAALIRLVANEPRNPEDEADGLALKAWRTARLFWQDGGKLIPEDIWRRLGLEPMIGAELAERRPNGIYVKGAEHHHAWALTRVKGGKTRAAKSRRDKHGRFLTSSIAGKSSSSAGEKSSSPSSSRSSTDQPFFLSLGENNSALVAQPPAEVLPPEPKGGDVWAAYRAAYFARYAVEPVRNAKTNAHCAQLVKRLGGEAAVAVVKFYLTHAKAWYVQTAHDLGACVKDAEALHTQMLSGYRVTQTKAQQADKQDANRQAFENVAKRLMEEKGGA
jgi:hypothetical protein